MLFRSCNELSESFRGLISAGRLLRGRQVSEKVNSPRRGEERFPWGTEGFEAQRTCIGWNKVDLATNAGGARASTARGGSGGAGRVMSVILVKHSDKTINVDNNYALAA